MRRGRGDEDGEEKDGRVGVRKMRGRVRGLEVRRVGGEESWMSEELERR